MTDSTQKSTEPRTDVVDAVRTVCERVDEPTEIWEALESKGIEATPGIVHQAISEPTDVASGAPEEVSLKPLAGSAGGLTARDIRVLARLVDKTGGVPALIAVLKSMQQIAE